MTGARKGIVVCDKCGAEFLVLSVKIKKCSVEIEGKVLLLDYFACTECNSIYKVNLYEESVYTSLVNDYRRIEKRIQNSSKGDKQLLKQLHVMADRKKNRIRTYIDGMNSKYTGTFVFDVSGDTIKYLSRV